MIRKFICNVRLVAQLLNGLPSEGALRAAIHVVAFIFLLAGLARSRTSTIEQAAGCQFRPLFLRMNWLTQYRFRLGIKEARPDHRRAVSRWVCQRLHSG